MFQECRFLGGQVWDFVLTLGVVLAGVVCVGRFLFRCKVGVVQNLMMPLPPLEVKSFQNNIEGWSVVAHRGGQLSEAVAAG